MFVSSCLLPSPPPSSDGGKTSRLPLTFGRVLSLRLGKVQTRLALLSLNRCFNSLRWGILLSDVLSLRWFEGGKTTL